MESSRPREVLRVPAFALFWSASTLRSFGSAVSAVAVQVLIVSVLHATPFEVGLLNALGVMPYLFLGLVVGALMDRWRRQRTLVVTSVGRAVVLAAIPVLMLLGALDLRSLAIVLLVQGVLPLFAQSAEQPLLPRLVPRRSLVIANARLAQSDTVASTAGPAAGGALLSLIGVPLLLLTDAIVTAIAAVLQSRIEVEEARPRRRTAGRLRDDIADGLRYTYGHRTLRPLALSVHLWFLGNSVIATVFAVFVLRVLDLPPWAFGLALAAGGVGGFAGAVCAPRLGALLGAGRAILLGRVLVVLPWPVLALLPLDARSGVPVLVGVVSAAQLVFGLGMGIEDPNDTGYRQSVAPDEVQGRMNATIRTVNRVVFLGGALLSGALATAIGPRAALCGVAAVFAAAAVVVLVSPLRTARFDDAPVHR